MLYWLHPFNIWPRFHKQGNPKLWALLVYPSSPTVWLCLSFVSLLCLWVLHRSVTWPLILLRRLCVQRFKKKRETLKRIKKNVCERINSVMWVCLHMPRVKSNLSKSLCQRAEDANTDECYSHVHAHYTHARLYVCKHGNVTPTHRHTSTRPWRWTHRGGTLADLSVEVCSTVAAFLIS